jgi:hypothetical protein
MSDLANLIPEALVPQSIDISLGNTIACDWINVGKSQMCFIVVHAYIAAAAAIVCTPQKAYAAAGTGAAALTINVPIWYGIKIAGVDTPMLTRAADAVNYTSGATAGDHIIVFQIDPASLGAEGSTPSLGPYNFIGGTFVSLAGDYVSVMAYLVPRYAGYPLTGPSYVA